MDEKSREAITKYLGDLHALETHGLQAMERQVSQLKDAGHPDAYRAVQDFKRTLETHVSALEARLKALGGSPTSPVKDAASAVLGLAAGLYNAVRNEEASKSIRDDYTFFSHSAVAHLMLHTTSKGLSDNETAALAERHYRDAARHVMQIDYLLPGLVIQELQQDKLQVMDVSDECKKMVRDAWEREAGSVS